MQESSAVWHDEKRNRDVPVKIYTPAGAAARRPLVIVSHGIGDPGTVNAGHERLTIERK